MEEEWQVVNNAQRKQQKNAQRKENQQKEKAAKQMEKDKEEEKQRRAKEEFMKQYVYAKQGVEEFSRFDSLRDEKYKEKLLDNDMISADDFETEESAQTKEKEPKKKPPKVKKPSVQEVAKKIDNAQLQELLVQFSERFPNNYEFQLKGLAEQFETIFNHADTKKPIEQDKPYLASLDLPYSYLQKDVVDSVKGWMDKMPEEALLNYYLFLLTTFISISIERKSAIQTSGVGLKMLIQLVGRNYAHVVVKAIPQIKQAFVEANSTALLPNFNPSLIRKELAPFFLWAFGQTLDRTNAALTVWFQLLLPLAVARSTADTIRDNSILFIETILQNIRNNSTLMDEVNAVSSYERLLLYKSIENVFPSRLEKLVPQLLDLKFVFGDKIPKRFFNMLLGHAASSNQTLRDEVLRTLVACLAADETCYTHWLEIYISTVAQSNNLVYYITLHWDKDALDKRLNPSSLVQVLKSFTKINKQLLAGTYVPEGEKKKKPKHVTNPDEVKEINMMNATCKALRKRLQGYVKESGSGLYAIIPVALVTAGAAAYLALNCCHLEWCASNNVLHDLLKCP